MSVTLSTKEKRAAVGPLFMILIILSHSNTCYFKVVEGRIIAFGSCISLYMLGYFTSMQGWAASCFFPSSSQDHIETIHILYAVLVKYQKSSRLDGETHYNYFTLN